MPASESGQETSGAGGMALGAVWFGRFWLIGWLGGYRCSHPCFAPLNHALETQPQPQPAKPQPPKTPTPHEQKRYLGQIKINLETKKLISADPLLLGGLNSTSPVGMDPQIVAAIKKMEGPVRALETRKSGGCWVSVRLTNHRIIGSQKRGGGGSLLGVWWLVGV